MVLRIRLPAVEFVGRLLSAERDELVLLFATPEMNFEDERFGPAIEERARTAAEPHGARGGARAVADCVGSKKLSNIK